MVALEITEIKDFMNKLLCQETFDNFLLKEAPCGKRLLERGRHDHTRLLFRR